MTPIALARTPRIPIATAAPDGQDRAAVNAGTPAMTAECRQRATRESLLAEFPASARAELLAAALPVELPAGNMLYRDADEPRCALVISGLVRAYLSALDGRTVTIRYVRTGELLGIPIMVGGPIPASIQMVTNAELLVLDARTLRMLVRVTTTERALQVAYLAALVSTLQVWRLFRLAPAATPPRQQTW